MSARCDPFEEALLRRVRQRDEDAWRELIALYEGRLLEYVRQRLHDRAAAEDVVQETFVGLLTSLPHYDPARGLENYLFAIASHKSIDYLRRCGRRPTVPLLQASDDSSASEPPGSQRAASSLACSRERRDLEERALVPALRAQLEEWRQRGEWTKLKCLELLLVCGLPNKDVAAQLNLSEQEVANLKSSFLQRLRKQVGRQVPAENLLVPWETP
jgi:RNA polymerase sigma-70 factor (ECF subfamily)